MLHDPLPAFVADNIVQDHRYEPPVVMWRRISHEDPWGDVIAVKTSYGIFIHCMLRKDGTIDDSVCQTTEATMSLYEDADGTARDFVLCVGPV